MCCSPIRKAVRVAIHYYTRAWQHVNTQKRMLYRHFICLPFQHKCLRNNHGTMFSPSLAEGLPCCYPIAARQLRHCRAVMVLQPCITKSKQSQNNVSQSLTERLQGCNPIVGYYNPASPKRTVYVVYFNTFNFYRIDTLGI